MTKYYAVMAAGRHVRLSLSKIELPQEMIGQYRNVGSERYPVGIAISFESDHTKDELALFFYERMGVEVSF